jgi:hypothetical protein
MKQILSLALLFFICLSANAQNAAPSLYIGLSGGASQALAQYAVFNPDNYAGGAQAGFSGSASVGGRIAEDWEWRASLNYSEHKIGTDDIYKSQTDIKNVTVTGLYATKGIGAGFGYFVPVSHKTRSGFTFSAALHYFINTMPNITVLRTPKLFESSTAERTGGTGGGLGYSAGIAYRQHFTNSKVFVFAEAQFWVADLNATGAAMTKTYPRELPYTQSLALYQNYTTANAHLGIGYFLK